MRRSTLLAPLLVLGPVLLAQGAVLARTFTCTRNPCEGTRRADTIYGTDGPESIYGYDGADQVPAGGQRHRGRRPRQRQSLRARR